MLDTSLLVVVGVFCLDATSARDPNPETSTSPCDACEFPLYYCAFDDRGALSCEMDVIVLAIVVAAALFTGCVVPLVCIALLVCGAWRRFLHCLASKKGLHSEYIGIEQNPSSDFTSPSPRQSKQHTPGPPGTARSMGGLDVEAAFGADGRGIRNIHSAQKLFGTKRELSPFHTNAKARSASTDI